MVKLTLEYFFFTMVVVIDLILSSYSEDLRRSNHLIRNKINSFRQKIREKTKKKRKISFEFGFYCSNCVTRMKELWKVLRQ